MVVAWKLSRMAACGLGDGAIAPGTSLAGGGRAGLQAWAAATVSAPAQGVEARTG
jgi:hypothetical protein